MPKPASPIYVIALRPHYLIELNKCLRKKAVWTGVCVCMLVFMLVFAYAVHLITSAGEVTAAALRGVQFPEKCSDLPSSKN